MAIIGGNDLGIALCAALGIDAVASKVSKITISAPAGDVASVTIVRWIDDEEADKIKEIFEKYELATKVETV